jgi:hypothetical protein
VAEQRHIVAPGTAKFLVRVHDTTTHSYRGLRIGISSVVDHQPEGGGSASPPLPGPCGAAAGTGYCGFPSLPPHGTVVETIGIRVPLHFSPGIKSTVGHQVRVEAFIDAHKSGGLPLTHVRHAHSLIVAPPGLPFTGFPATDVIALGSIALLAGVVVSAAGRRRVV